MMLSGEYITGGHISKVVNTERTHLIKRGRLGEYIHVVGVRGRHREGGFT